MNLLKKLLVAAALLSTGLAQAAYMPTGVQTNVSMSQVASWGWTTCYSDSGSNYSASGSLASIANSCNGKYMMLADYQTGSSDYAILAAAATSEVMLNTGDRNNVTHTANGAEWYYSPSWSWGFTALGNSVNRNSCDVNLAGWNGPATIGSCWHTGGNALNSGWTYNNGSGATYTANRVILIANELDSAAVPEPGSLAILAIGLTGLLAARAKRNKV
jgi:hypothetical protein